MASLYLDEDLTNFEPGLRAAGHQVRLASDAGPGRTDVWHLNRAAHDQRILITFNYRDYRYLHRLWTSVWSLGIFSRLHGGIISATRQLDADVWIPTIDRLLREDANVRGRMLTWHEAAQSWREDDWRPERL